MQPRALTPSLRKGRCLCWRRLLILAAAASVRVMACRRTAFPILSAAFATTGDAIDPVFQVAKWNRSCFSLLEVAFEYLGAINIFFWYFWGLLWIKQHYNRLQCKLRNRTNFPKEKFCTFSPSLFVHFNCGPCVSLLSTLSFLSFLELKKRAHLREILVMQRTVKLWLKLQL